MELWNNIGSSVCGNAYCVSTMGRIWSSKNGVLKTPLNQNGYTHLSLDIDGKWHRHLVHRIVANSFIPNPFNKPTVNHKNGIRNDNRIENLEWATSKEQNLHSYQVLNRKSTENAHRRKTIIAYRDGLPIVVEKDGIREMERELGVPYQAIQRILKSRRDKCYFGWHFELLHDPKWISKSGLTY